MFSTPALIHSMRTTMFSTPHSLTSREPHHKQSPPPNGGGGGDSGGGGVVVTWSGAFMLSPSHPFTPTQHTSKLKHSTLAPLHLGHGGGGGGGGGDDGSGGAVEMAVVVVSHPAVGARMTMDGW